MHTSRELNYFVRALAATGFGYCSIAPPLKFSGHKSNSLTIIKEMPENLVLKACSVPIPSELGR